MREPANPFQPVTITESANFENHGRAIDLENNPVLMEFGENFLTLNSMNFHSLSPPLVGKKISSPLLC